MSLFLGGDVLTLCNAALTLPLIHVGAGNFVSEGDGVGCASDSVSPPSYPQCC
jgi:hypothetical protein